MSEPQFVAETLAWCNERRAEKDLEPLDALPKGKREDPQTCPCGRATGLWVDSEAYGIDQESWARNPIPLPGAVTDFVAAFDDCELPQYDEKPPEGDDEDWSLD